MSNELVLYGNMSLQDTMKLGETLAKSGFFQDSKGAAQAVVKILAGRELGFGPITSMTGINVIRGRVTLSANLIAAAIKGSGKYDFKVAHLDDEKCSIVFYEGGKQIGESSFTMSDAKQAELSGGNWTKYPRNMLFARAISNGAKWHTPDVFGGPVYTPDELGANVDGETGDIIEVYEPDIDEDDYEGAVEEPEPPLKNKDVSARKPQAQNGGTDWNPKKMFGVIQEQTANHFKDVKAIYDLLGEWPDFSDEEAVQRDIERAVQYVESISPK